MQNSLQRPPRHHLRTSPSESFGVFLNTCLHSSNVHIISNCTSSCSTRNVIEILLLPKTLNQSVNCWSAKCISKMKKISIWSLCLNNRMLTFKIKLNHFGSLFCAEFFHHKFPKFRRKFWKEKQKNVNNKFIRLLNHNVTYAPPYIKLSVLSNINPYYYYYYIYFWYVSSIEFRFVFQQHETHTVSTRTVPLFVVLCPQIPENVSLQLSQHSLFRFASNLHFTYLIHYWFYYCTVH